MEEYAFELHSINISKEYIQIMSNLTLDKTEFGQIHHTNKVKDLIESYRENIIRGGQVAPPAPPIDPPLASMFNTCLCAI